MTPVYLVAKVLAIATALVGLWQIHWDLSGDAGKALLGIIITALGSLFEKVPWVNSVLSLVTKFLGLPYTPDAPVDTTVTTTTSASSTTQAPPKV